MKTKTKKTANTKKVVCQECSNWNPTKGNPYDYTIFNYRDTISKDTEWKIVDDYEIPKPVKEIGCWNHLQTVSTLTLSQAEEIFGIEIKNPNKFNGSFYKWFEKDLDTSKPVITYLSYPFSKKIKLTIYPLVRVFGEKATTKASKTRILDHIGYYIWQIANVYADIYKNHYKEIGIWGHGFEDLILERIRICKNNQLDIFIGS